VTQQLGPCCKYAFIPVPVAQTASMHQTAYSTHNCAFRRLKDPPFASEATNNMRRALRAMRVWRNVRNNIDDLIMQQRDANSLCACTLDELKPPNTTAIA